MRTRILMMKVYTSADQCISENQCTSVAISAYHSHCAHQAPECMSVHAGANQRIPVHVSASLCNAYRCTRI